MTPRPSDLSRLCCSFTVVGQNHLMASLRVDGHIHLFIEFPGPQQTRRLHAVKAYVRKRGGKVVETALVRTPILRVEFAPRKGDPACSFISHLRSVSQLLSVE